MRFVTAMFWLWHFHFMWMAFLDICWSSLLFWRKSLGAEIVTILCSMASLIMALSREYRAAMQHVCWSCLRDEQESGWGRFFASEQEK